MAFHIKKVIKKLELLKRLCYLLYKEARRMQSGVLYPKAAEASNSDYMHANLNAVHSPL